MRVVYVRRGLDILISDSHRVAVVTRERLASGNVAEDRKLARALLAASGYPAVALDKRLEFPENPRLLRN